jgi:hypothetical protein
MKSSVVRLKLAALLLIPLGLGIGYFSSVASHTKSPELAGPQTGAPRACPDSTPFPAGFDYPQTAATVEQWVKSRNDKKIREHGWYLWAGLNLAAPDGSPAWRTWCTSTQAFATGLQQMQATASGMTGQVAASAETSNPQLSINAKRLANASTGGAEPINFPNPPYYPLPPQVKRNHPKCVEVVPGPNGLKQEQLKDGFVFQNNGDIMVAGVIYNDPAYNWIRDQKLYLAPNLNCQLPPPLGTGPMPAMPAGSIVLKPMMWPVQGKGYTALPLWDDPPAGDGGKYVGFEIQQKWPRAVAVTPQAQRVVRTSVNYLYGVYTNNMLGRRQIGPLTYRDAEVVPVDQFYYFQPDLKKMSDCDHAILDASAYWTYNKAFSAGDYLVLIAMHVMTKEQPDWTFQSVWWHDRPDRGPYATFRPDIPPSQAPGPWRHYLMTSTYGTTQRPGGKQLPVAYNPYIELAADHPIVTNCMNCHHRAAWPHQLSSYLAPGANAPDALDTFAMNNPIFNGLLTLDSMWGISDRATWPSAGQR